MKKNLKQEIKFFKNTVVVVFCFFSLILSYSLPVQAITMPGPTATSSPAGPGAPNGTFCMNPGNVDPACQSGYCGPDEVCEYSPGSCMVTGCPANNICNQNNGRCEALVGDPGAPPVLDLCRGVVCDFGCSPSSGQCLPSPSSTSTGPIPYPVGSSDTFCGGDPNLVFIDGLCLPADKACNDDSFLCTNNITDLIVKIVKFLLGLAGIIAVLILVIGGYWYLASAGNEETAEKGKKTIMNAIIGLVIIMLSYAIVSIIANTLGN